MKKTLSFSILLITLQITAFTQCGVNYRELLDKYCNGVYLQHQELYNTSNGKVTFMLKKENRYAIYLLNPSRILPEFKIVGSRGTALKDLVSTENKKEKISTCIFTAGETGEYDFSYRFNTKEDACVLMAVYLQNLTIFQPGVYKSFEEMKFNNPSSAIETRINSRADRLAGHQQVTFYKLERSGEAKVQGKPFGFSDGKNQYIKRIEGAGLINDYIRIDNYGKYGYFEDIGYGMAGTTPYPFLTINLIDLNSGDITRIDKKHLREILADDPKLLNAFESESQKDKKLKEYLIRYLEDRIDAKFEKNSIPPYKIIRTMSYVRYSITKSSESDNNIRFRFFMSGVETHLGPVFTTSSGEVYSYGSIAGIRNPAFPVDIKVRFAAQHYFAPNSSYEVIFEFTINEPGAWDVRLSY